MKILYHHRTVSKDGMDVHITSMIDALRKLGHEVVVVAPALGAKEFGGEGGWVSTIRARMPRFVGEALELGYNLAAYRNLARAIRAERPDAIYERYALFLLAGIWAKRRFKLPLALEINSPLFAERCGHGGLALRSLARWSEQTAWRGADICLPVTEVLAADVRGAGVRPELIVVVPNGVDLADFDPAAVGDAVRKRYGLEDRIVLGFSGFVRPWHGLDAVLHAVAELGPKANAHLLIVGDGPARPELLQLAARLNVERQLTFTGVVQRREIAAHIAAFDIALQPDATPYASPLKLVEYMAMGKAIVAPDQANIRELLENERTALLFDKSNADDMRLALMRLIRDRELCGRLGRAAAEEVRRRPLTWVANAKGVVSVLARLSADRL